MFKQSRSCPEPLRSSTSGKGLRWELSSIRGAATMGTDPEHPPPREERGREREREVWGEATGIIT